MTFCEVKSYCSYRSFHYVVCDTVALVIIHLAIQLIKVSLESASNSTVSPCFHYYKEVCSYICTNNTKPPLIFVDACDSTCAEELAILAHDTYP